MSAHANNSLWWADDAVRSDHGYRRAVEAIEDTRGTTVRCTPHRRTVARVVAGATVFCKFRTRRPRDAHVEWGMLARLQQIGIAVPRRIYLARDGVRTAIATAAVPGRPADLVALDAARDRQLDALRATVVEAVAPKIRRLHEARLVYRDLYWNHIFVDRLGADARVTFIDVERVFRPRLRWRRWVVKDLAGLLSSWPLEDASIIDALFDAYGATPDLVRAARAKAARILAHRPKYG